MMTLTVGILNALTRCNSQSPPRRFQILVAPSLTRLQVISLGPFIPRVDEDERFSGNARVVAAHCEKRSLSAYNFPQPSLIEFRRGVNHNRRISRTPGAIVPARTRTRYP